MTLEETMSELEALGDESIRKQKYRNAGGHSQFGVKTGDLRTLAKKIKTNPELANSLWETGNVDAMMLATQIMAPKKLSTDEVERLVQTAKSTLVIDWLMTNVVKVHPQKEALRQKWMESGHTIESRAAWSLTTERVIKSPEGLDIPHLLDRIEAEMKDADEVPQWTMNYCLAEIGINFPEHRERAVAIGEKLGVLRDFPVSKGCVSPFAPNWINEMVKRKA